MHWWYNRFPFNKIQLNCQLRGKLFCDSDVGDIGTGDLQLVTDLCNYLISLCWWPIFDIGDLILILVYQWWIVTNILKMSPTHLVTNIDVIHFIFFYLQHIIKVSFYANVLALCIALITIGALIWSIYGSKSHAAYKPANGHTRTRIRKSCLFMIIFLSFISSFATSVIALSYSFNL